MKGNHLKLGLAIGASLIGILAGGAANAHSVASEADAADQPKAGSGVAAGDDIIVTARRAEERLQDVPISITVFNQQQISNRNVATISDLATYTPSLSANNRFGTDNTTFSIRGFVQEGPTSPSVAVYFADVVAPRANGSIASGNGAGPGSFFDLQNVQVLKGPQGTLFGRNTTGGAILLVPQKPTSKLEGYVELSAGNYNMWRTQGVINIPLSDSVRFRLGVDHESRDGYLHNVGPLGPKDFADIDYTAVRASIVADLSPDIEDYAIFDYSISSTNGSMLKVINNLYGAPNIAAELSATSGNFWDVENGIPNPHQRIQQYGVINTLSWQVSDNLKIKDVASFHVHKESQTIALFGDFSTVPGSNPLVYDPSVTIFTAPGESNVAQKSFTNELQFQGHTSDNRFVYQGGAYLEVALPMGWQGTYAGIFIACTDLLALKCANNSGFGNIQYVREQYKFRNLGIYAQGTYKFTDQLSLTAGLRYTSDRTSGIGDQTTIAFPAPNTPYYVCNNGAGAGAAVAANVDLCQVGAVQSSAKPTWLIDLDYKPTPDTLIYAKYSRGYRQGSVNVALVGAASFYPEKVDTYEIGAKLSFNGPISGSLNMAAFYNNFTNQQLNVNLTSCTAAELVSNPTQCPFVGTPTAATANAGKSRIQGVEVDGSISPFAGLKLDVGYAFLDTKLQSFIQLTPPPGYTREDPTSVVGGPLTNTPKHKVTLSGTYTLPVDQKIGTISFGVTYSYQSKFYNTSTAAPGYAFLPGQSNLNLNANWRSVNGLPVDLSLFMTNVTNEKFYQVTEGGSFGFDQAILNPPRMFGGRIKWHFGG